MKTKMVLIVMSFILVGTTNLIAQDIKTENFKVYGNCGMCKKTIEGGLSDVEGIISSEWNVETKMMKVKYDESAISLADIKKKIAAVGYDTEKERAEDEVYNKLHGCCQYERPAK